jgi:2-alkyl-3-oxoalkanoate reductase
MERTLTAVTGPAPAPSEGYQPPLTEENIMKVFVAGASGALGRRLVPLLVSRGYDVVAMTRSPEKTGALREMDAEPVVADGLDRAALTEAVMNAEPDVLMHQMTGLTGIRSFKHLDAELATTNRLRTEGLDNILEAARTAGVGRVIAQSYGLWDYVVADGALATEEDEIDPNVPATMTMTLAALRRLEARVGAAEDLDGIVLRYGFFYGPGTGISEQGSIAAGVRARRFPVAGEGRGKWSFIHVEDAAAATAAAVERGRPGVYNVVDDEPVA